MNSDNDVYKVAYILRMVPGSMEEPDLEFIENEGKVVAMSTPRGLATLQVSRELVLLS